MFSFSWRKNLSREVIYVFSEDFLHFAVLTLAPDRRFKNTAYHVLESIVHIYGQLPRLSYYGEVCEAVVRLSLGFSSDLPSKHPVAQK
jgi:hypothetical protein